jgi:hypothetical protein
MAEARTAEAPQKKKKKELTGVEIKQGEKGGHVVTHRYTGGDEPWQSNEETFPFGKEDGEELLNHLKKHLAIKSGESEEQTEHKSKHPTRRTPPGTQEHEGEDAEQEGTDDEDEGDDKAEVSKGGSKGQSTRKQ